MYNKENFEIHLFAILEGTGHFQRTLYIKNFLEDHNFKVKIFAYDYHNKYKNSPNIFFDLHKSFIDYTRRIYFFNQDIEIPLEENIKYLLILDIRDTDPSLIFKKYEDSVLGILCMDNYYKKYEELDYFYSLPHPQQITQNVLNYYFFPYFLLKKKMDVSISSKMIFYWGDYSLLEFDNSHIEKIILEKFKLDLEVLTFDSQNYLPQVEFYKLFLESEIICTYPGLLLYEAILLNKKIISFYTKSEIHNQILNTIIKDYKEKIVEISEIDQTKFVFFNFSKGKNNLNFNNLWTSYFHLKNWIEKKIYEHKR